MSPSRRPIPTGAIPAPLLALLACLLLLPATTPAAERPAVTVAAPYLEMHTGPGMAYPVFHVVPKGERVRILKRRTDWFEVRTRHGKTGWVTRHEIEQTLVAEGVRLQIAEADEGDFLSRRWEIGVLGGRLEGDESVTVYTGYAFNPGLSAEVSLSQVLGRFSDSLMLGLDLLAQPFRHWRAAPFFSLGAGIIDTRARKTVVASRDGTDPVAHAGIGLRVYLGRRFILRGEYRSDLILTNRNDNKEIDEWRLGFASFF